jgi:hypothetical protein
MRLRAPGDVSIEFARNIAHIDSICWDTDVNVIKRTRKPLSLIIPTASVSSVSRTGTNIPRTLSHRFSLSTTPVITLPCGAVLSDDGEAKVYSKQTLSSIYFPCTAVYLYREPEKLLPSSTTIVLS